MADVTNIDCFNLACAHVFSVLYGSFPKPVVMNTDRLADEARLPEGCGWVERQGQNIFSHTLAFLADEGFIRYSADACRLKFANVTLTTKGLMALNRVPKSLAPGATVGDQLRSLGESAQSVASIGALVSTVLEQL